MVFVCKLGEVPELWTYIDTKIRQFQTTYYQAYATMLKTYFVDVK